MSRETCEGDIAKRRPVDIRSVLPSVQIHPIDRGVVSSTAVWNVQIVQIPLVSLGLPHEGCSLHTNQFRSINVQRVSIVRKVTIDDSQIP